jgi:hypothetical protein
LPSGYLWSQTELGLATLVLTYQTNCQTACAIPNHDVEVGSSTAVISNDPSFTDLLPQNKKAISNLLMAFHFSSKQLNGPELDSVPQRCKELI